MRQFFRTKSIECIANMAQKSSLKKSLGLAELISLGIGGVLGTGIFVLTGIAAAQYAGPAISISFVICGCLCIFVGLAYAELASMFPTTGSAYTYIYASLGEGAAFLTGWNLLLAYTVTASAVAVGWSGYIVGLLKTVGISVGARFTVCAAEGGVVNLPAVIIILLLTVLLMRGTRESVRLNVVLVLVKILTVIIFIFLAMGHVQAENWEPFAPYGVDGILGGAAMVFFAFMGFDTIATSAEECKNPTRDLPIGIIASLLICTVLYVVVSALLTGIVPYPLLNNAEPVAYGIRYIGYRAGSGIVAVGAIAGMTTVLLVYLYGQARIFFAMARDGLFPVSICKVHAVYRTPYIVNVIGGLVIALISGFIPLARIVEIANTGTLAVFLVMFIGVLALRIRHPEYPRKFRCPLLWGLAVIGILSCAFLIYSLSSFTHLLFLLWIWVGMLVYFLYSGKHSI